MGEWEQWENAEAYRIGQTLYSDPNCGANALRQDLQSIPPNRQLELVRKTQAYTPYGSAGQVYETPIMGPCGDTGQRNVTVLTNQGSIEVMNLQPYAPQVCQPTVFVPPPIVFPAPNISFDFEFGTRFGRRR